MIKNKNKIFLASLLLINIFIFINHNLTFAQDRDLENLKKDIADKLNNIFLFGGATALYNDIKNNYGEGILKFCIVDLSDYQCKNTDFDISGFTSLMEDVNSKINRIAHTSASNIIDFLKDIDYMKIDDGDYNNSYTTKRTSFSVTPSGRGPSTYKSSFPMFSLGYKSNKSDNRFVNAIKLHILEKEGTSYSYEVFFDIGEIKKQNNNVRDISSVNFFYFYEDDKKYLINRPFDGYLSYLKASSTFENLKDYVNNFYSTVNFFNTLYAKFSDCYENIEKLRYAVLTANTATIKVTGNYGGSSPTVTGNLKTLKENLDLYTSSTVKDEISQLVNILKKVYEPDYKKGGGLLNLIYPNYNGKIINVYANNLKGGSKMWKNREFVSGRLTAVLNSFCHLQTLLTGKDPFNRNIDDVLEDFKSKSEAFQDSFPGLYYVEITPQEREVPIAVIPPIIWSDKHEGPESFKAITPQRIFDEIKNFLFTLAPIIFIILLIIGAVFYIASPIKIEYLQSGSEYLKWAVIGYFVLLVVSAIFSLLKTIFGGP
jgi:hypothetical protein